MTEPSTSVEQAIDEKLIHKVLTRLVDWNISEGRCVHDLGHKASDRQVIHMCGY
jgi:hypothetical protein